MALHPLIKWLGTILVSVILGFVLNATLSTSMLPTPDVKISEPQEKDITIITPIVIGTYSGSWGDFYSGWGKGIRNLVGPYMWVAVNPYGNPNWYPQGDDHIDPLNNSWRLPIRLGGEDTVGTKFEIAVFFVNKEDDRYLRNYVDICRQANFYPAITPPNSAIKVASVTVTTRSGK